MSPPISPDHDRERARPPPTTHGIGLQKCSRDRAQPSTEGRFARSGLHRGLHEKSPQRFGSTEGLDIGSYLVGARGFEPPTPCSQCGPGSLPVLDSRAIRSTPARLLPAFPVTAP